MRSKIAGLILLSLTATVFAADTDGLAIIPLPQKIQRLDGAFQLAPGTRIYVDSASRQTGNFLAGKLRPSTGYPLKVSAELFSSAAIKGGILLTIKNASTNLGRGRLRTFRHAGFRGHSRADAGGFVLWRANAVGIVAAGNFFHESCGRTWLGRFPAFKSKTGRDSNGAG